MSFWFLLLPLWLFMLQTDTPQKSARQKKNRYHFLSIQKTSIMEFSFRRLFFAIKRLFVTDSKDIYYNALVLLALGAATPLIQRVILNFDYSSMAFIYACIMIFSCIAIKSFGDFKTNAKRSVGILLPCSVLEKYLAEFIYVFVIKNMK